MKKTISNDILIKLTLAGLTFLLLMTLLLIEYYKFQIHQQEALIQTMQEIEIQKSMKRSGGTVVKSPVGDNPYRTQSQWSDEDLITVTTFWKEWWGKEYRVLLKDKYTF